MPSDPSRSAARHGGNDHDRAVALLLDAFGARIVGEYATSPGGIPGRCGRDAWGDEPAHRRDEPCSCCPKTTAAERAASTRRYGRGSESELRRGPRCEECGADAVVLDVDDESLLCALWWRRGVHHCELCRRRPGRWSGHAWACDRCVERVASRFRAGVLDQGAR